MKHMFIFTEPMCVPRKNHYKVVVLECNDSEVESKTSVAKKLVTTQMSKDLRLSSVVKIDGRVLIESFSCVTVLG